MRHILWVVVAASAIAGSIVAARCDEPAAPTPPPAEKLQITNNILPNEARDYKVDIAIRDKIADPQTGKPVDWKANVTWQIRHRYSRREGDGALPMEISLLGGSIDAQGQKLQISSGLYPKLTLLIEPDYRISAIYGAAGRSQNLPGINYANLIMLFLLPNSDPKAIGEKWDYLLKLPELGEAYAFTNTFTGVDTIDGVKAIKLHQDIKRMPYDETQTPVPQMTAKADSMFAIDTGKLLKSHVECEAPSGLVSPPAPGSAKPTEQEAAPAKANITVDIALAK